MSSQKDALDTLSGYYQAFNAKDWLSMTDFLHDTVRHDVNEGSQRRGKAEFADFFAADG